MLSGHLYPVGLIIYLYTRVQAKSKGKSNLSPFADDRHTETVSKLKNNIVDVVHVFPPAFLLIRAWMKGMEAFGFD